MTARNVQDKAKKAGLPWSTAKGFDSFTPISAFVPKDAIADPSNVNLWLKVNDELRQNGNTQDMIFDIPALLAHVSSIMTLDVGDVILTGTCRLLTQARPRALAKSTLGTESPQGCNFRDRPRSWLSSNCVPCSAREALFSRNDEYYTTS